jgi:ATP-dependent DNA ligase
MKFMQIKPQKARGKFLESMWTNPAWSAENKEDGDRRIAQFMGARVRFTGTRESVKCIAAGGGEFVEKSENLPHLDGGVRHAAAPAFFNNANPAWATRNKMLKSLEGTVLDGEIVYPGKVVGGGSKYVTAVMGSLPERAAQLQHERGWLEYVVFDCLFFRGEDLRHHSDLSTRKHFLFKAIKIWGNKHARQATAYTKESEKRAAWESAPEGLVFKHEEHTYGNEKLWVKLKKEATADVVIMGFAPGKGKYIEQVGSIIFGQYFATKADAWKPGLHRMGTCSGFDDMTRQGFSTIAQTHNKYVGKVIEIMHNGREPTGAFRHPRFKRFRPDKNQKDCVYDPEET